MSITLTKTNTQEKTNAKCFKDPMYVIFLKSREFKDFKFDMDIKVSDMAVMDMDVVDTKTNTKRNTQTKTNAKCFKDLMCYIYIFEEQGVQGFQI